MNEQQTASEQELARVTLEFLNRTNLQAPEVHTFLAVQAWLNGKITPPVEVPAPVGALASDG